VTRKEDLADLRIDGNPAGPAATDGHVQYLSGNYALSGTSWQPALSKNVTRSEEHPIEGAAGSPYVVVRCQVASGRHTISSFKPFAAYQYGFGEGSESFDSYGNTCGEELRNTK
jgi:hypothetical protein